MSATVLSAPAIDRVSASESERIVAALHRDGAVLVPGVLDPAEALRRADSLAALPLVAGDSQWPGPESDLITTIFNRDPAWLDLLDPPGVIEAMERALGWDCHIVNQKGWRNRPGYRNGKVHVDHLFVPMPEEWCQDPRYTPPLFIISALLYLSDIDADLAPTSAWPGSHRSGRAPRDGETAWHGQEGIPVLCRAGDMLLFRCDVWHSGSANTSADRTRFVIETAYAQRCVAQKFWPYLDFTLAPATRAAASPRQLRLLGEHPISSYG